MDNTATTTGPFTITTSSTASGVTLANGIYVNSSYYSPPYANMYEEDGNLFWKNSKGEVFKLTFTKQETVKQIIQDL